MRLLIGRQRTVAAAGSLGVLEQTLFNWVKADRQGKLKGPDSKVVSAAQTEISRLRAEHGVRIPGARSEWFSDQ